MKLTEAKAIVLAAGLGTRLRPLTLTTPKPLVEVGGKTLLDWALDQIAEAGITEAVVNTSYLYEKVEAHVEQRLQHTPRPTIHISREMPQPLETGGGIYKALPQLGNAPFIVLNSDTICMNGARPALERLWNAWQEAGGEIDFLMLMQPLSRAVGFYANGDFMVDPEGVIRRPNEGEVARYVFTGIEVIHPRVFVDCPEGAFSLNALWNRSRLPDGRFARLRALIHDGDWLHVGDAQGLADVSGYFSR